MLQQEMTPKADFAHLTTDARDLLDAPIEAKRKHVLDIPFIKHGVADKMLVRLWEIYNAPQSIRPWSASLIGETGVGKTSLVTEFKTQVEALTPPSAGFVPIAIAQAPSPCSVPSIELNIARALQLTFSRALSPRQISVLVLESLRNLRTQMLIIEEMHHIAPLDWPERKTILNMLKGLTNAGLHIILVGTKEFETILLDGEPQIFNRFKPTLLDRFTEGSDYLGFLHQIESDYPLLQPSKLYELPKSEYIFDITSGNPGEIVQLCAMAALHAMSGNKPCIDAASLKECGYMPMPKR